MQTTYVHPWYLALQRLCGTEEDLVIDHDHRTNKVRHNLCRTCNLGIGKLGDNLDLLKNAVKYLSTHETTD